MSKPLRIAYDISRLSAGGANGGIKVHHYEFLRCFTENFSQHLQLHIFCQEEIAPELSFLADAGNHQIHILGPRSDFEPRDSDPTLPPLHYWSERPENLLVLLEIDVLYAGFGFSQLYTPEVPQVSLIVDVLHRAYPESLPPAEVEFRDYWYAEELEKAVLVQTNSEYCKRQLVSEFGTDPNKIFVISVPVHERFDAIPTGPLPPKIADLAQNYFLYPANYWPHKNHEALIEAYRIYAEQHGDDAHKLVLTGQIEERGAAIRALIEEMGLADRIHQIGHLAPPSFKAVWENAIAILFPSKYEGFGIPLLEAAYFRKPIICSDIPCYSSTLRGQARTVAPDAIFAWAEAMRSIDAHPQALDPAFDLQTETNNLFRAWENAASCVAKPHP